MNQSKIFLFIFVLALSTTDLFFNGISFFLSQRIYDIGVKKLAESEGFSDQIVLIDISQDSLANLEKDLGKWPWPRAVHADLLNIINAAQAKAVIFDILFNEKDIQNPESDGAFDVALENVKSYLPTLEVNGKFLKPTVVSEKHWRTGHIHFDLDSDGIGRNMPIKTASGLKPIVEKVAENSDGGQFRSANTTQKKRIKFLKTDSLTRYEYSDLLTGKQTFDSQGKYIIIGTTAPGLGDFSPTPLFHTYPGVYILATALENNLQNKSILDYSSLASFLALLLISFLMLFIYIRYSHSGYLALSWTWLILALLALIVDYLSLELNFYFSFNRAIISSIPILMTLMALHFFDEKMQRLHIEGTFSRFMDPKIIKTLLSSHQLDLNIPAKAKEITLLFSDIRGFTTLSESRAPEEISKILNQYFTLQVATIFKYGGTLDKFIGDAVMAFWGAPLEHDSPSDHAVSAALEMIENAKSLGLDIGVGLHRGSAVVGLLGSPQRMEYTAIGDTVNLASRVEGLTKDYGSLLISEETHHNIKNKSAFKFKAVGEVKVKGRSEAVKLFLVE